MTEAEFKIRSARLPQKDLLKSLKRIIKHLLCAGIRDTKKRQHNFVYLGSHSAIEKICK